MSFASLTINLNTIKSNIATIRNQLPKDSQLLLVAKANAYGLGAVEIAQALDGHIDYLGVSTVREATELRENGIKIPILLLSEPFPEELNIISSLDLTITLYDKSTIDLVNDYATHMQSPIKTHLKIDTGLTRLGAHWDNAKNTMSHWNNTSKWVIKEGIYSHYANSNEKDHPLNELQQHRFDETKKAVKTPLTHLSNSDGLTHFKNSQCNVVRIGLSIYNNSFKLSAPIRLIKTISAGTSVSYGSTFTAKKTTNVGVIGMGYADGLSSQLSNKGYVNINGINCPIIGQICMCMFMVELPNTNEIQPSSMATILSPSDQPGMSLQELAELTNQNPREIMTRFSQRVTRLYIS
ncbi:MAG: alanine racemase [Candidatus Margulisiibacteriota bacterium]